MERHKASPSKYLLAAVLSVALLLSACGAKEVELALKNIQLSSPDATGALVISSTFSPKTERITASFELASPAYPLTVVERLYYLDATSPVGAKQDFLVTEGELTSDYAGTQQMTATRPQKGWPQGNYKIELYQKDKYDQPLGVANFVVL